MSTKPPEVPMLYPLTTQERDDLVHLIEGGMAAKHYCHDDVNTQWKQRLRLLKEKLA